MKKHRISKLIISMGLAIAVAVTSVAVPFNRKCENIRNSVFRLHIIANSDSEVDQAMKLKVRDGMLDLAENLFKDAADHIEAKEIAEQNIGLLKQNAIETLAKNGCSEDVSVTVGKAWFGTREYDDFTLPAGEYDALRIVIGEGEGKNWWCVMFPAVCLPAAKGDIEDALDSAETEIVKGKIKYKAAFKIVEIYESVKRFFKK